MESYSNVCPGVGYSGSKLWSKLGLLCSPDWNTKLSIQCSWSRYWEGGDNNYIIYNLIYVAFLQSSYLATAPYLALFILGLIFGPIADWLVGAKILSAKNVRKLMNSIGKYSSIWQINISSWRVFWHFKLFSIFVSENELYMLT